MRVFIDFYEMQFIYFEKKNRERMIKLTSETFTDISL